MLTTALKNGYLASGGYDSIIIIWNLNDGSIVRKLSGHSVWVTALNVLENGNLVSGGGDVWLKYGMLRMEHWYEHLLDILDQFIHLSFYKMEIW